MEAKLFDQNNLSFQKPLAVLSGSGNNWESSAAENSKKFSRPRITECEWFIEPFIQYVSQLMMFASSFTNLFKNEKSIRLLPKL